MSLAYMVYRARGVYFQDGLLTVHNSDFRKDPKFREAYRNNAAPEIAAAEHFWDRLVSGGIVVLDDYGWTKHINQKHAFDEFANARGVKVLGLPTGQGLIIKP